MKDAATQLVPELRFPEFRREWSSRRTSELLDRVSISVDVDPEAMYREIGIRSHGRGVFHKDPAAGAVIGEKRVFEVVPNTLAFNIVFAWEQALAILTEDDRGFIASHRFPMYAEKDEQSDIFFLRHFFLRPRGKYLLELASPGGAGRNKTLGQKDFADLRLVVPCRDEQRKIAAFLGAVDTKIAQLGRKKALLKDYKKGCMQQLFSQAIRFKNDNDRDFPEWETKLLRRLFTEPKQRNRDLEFGREHVLSVSGEYGCVNQIEHLGRSYAGVSVRDYHVVRHGDVVYTKSPLKDSPYGIIKTNKGCDGIVSTLYAVYRPTQEADAEYIDYYFQLDDNLNRYLRPIVRKGAKNDMKVNNSDVLGDPILVPHPDEQRKIADFLSTLDVKIDLVSQELTQAQTFKKGLLQQMFV